MLETNNNLMPFCIVHGLSYCGGHWILTVGDISALRFPRRETCLDKFVNFALGLGQRCVSEDFCKSTAGGAVLSLRVICRLLVDAS